MNTNSSLLLLAVLTVVLTDKVYQTFGDYVNEHGHKFANQEERDYRAQVYNSNVKSIMAHNNDPHSQYKQGINQFTIWTHAEFDKTMLTVRPTPDMLAVQAVAAPTVAAVWNPTPIEYTLDSKNITSVKNQGQCGSCWAFATIASIESLSYIANGTVADYSEQQLVSCSSVLPYKNKGCGGGWHYWSFPYITANGLVNEADYPYVSGSTKVTGDCIAANTANQVVRISSYTNVTKDCPSVAAALLQRPLVVGLNATYWGSYKSGVFPCNTSNANHEVLLVGVNSSTWKIKNQWGTGWGMAGFMYLNATGGLNACSICNYVSYPNK